MVDARAPLLLFTGAGSKLLLCERDSDVAIVVEFGGSQWRYPAHRLVLSTMSDVFRRMFDIDMRESSSREVVVRDANPLAMKQFLRFLYLGTIDFTDWHEVLELMTVAHKYRVHELIQLCEKQLLAAVSLSNACVLHEVSLLYGLEALKTESQDLILDAAFVVSFTEGFAGLGRKSLEFFIASHKFNVENEGSVLSALREWATAECSRRCKPLSRDNIVEIMEPLLKHVDFSLIPESQRTFVPRKTSSKHETSPSDVHRVNFFVPPSLHGHISILKFVVELGAYGAKSVVNEPLNCLKFCVDSYLFVAGFRMVALFKSNFHFGGSSPVLMLGKEDSRHHIQFNLNSLPWKCGTAVGEYTWKEMVAYLPHPARVDPFSTYLLSVKYGNMIPTKWPRTRLESNTVTTELYPINFYAYGPCIGITELFLLPAPPYKHICNKSVNA